MARENSKGMSGHHQPHRGHSDTWLTPPSIIESLGPFDLDPCAPPTMPWPTASRMISLPEDGYAAEWRGRVWLNPPYGPEMYRWVGKLADHGDGIALIFARTETFGFFAHVWNRATALLFIRGRLHFHHACGRRAKANSGAPSVLVAYGDQNARALAESGIGGRFLRLADCVSAPLAA